MPVILVNQILYFVQRRQNIFQGMGRDQAMRLAKMQPLPIFFEQDLMAVDRSNLWFNDVHV
jgi:hypothetical protein